MYIKGHPFAVERLSLIYVMILFTSIKRRTKLIIFSSEHDDMSKSLAGAVHIAEQPSQFTQFNGYQELALFIWKENDFILSFQLHAG